MESLKERLFSLADAMWAKGQNPTIRSLREAGLSGSNRDALPYLREWRNRPRPEAAVSGGDRVARAEMEEAVAREAERFEQLRRHLMLETDRIRQGAMTANPNLIEKVRRLEDENAYLKSRIAALERERR